MPPINSPQVTAAKINKYPPAGPLSPEKVEEVFLSELLERADRAEIQKYYQEVLEKSEGLFDSYAGAKRPKFEFTSDPSISTAVFMVDAKGGRPQIKIGLDFFVKNRIDADQAVWVLMHELTHFIDYAENKKYYMGQFENAKKLGAKMSDKVAEYFKSKNGEEVPEVRKNKIAGQAAKIYSSGYYNIMNDIFVNHNVATTPEYSHDKNKNPDSKQGRVSDLYKDTLFKESDFSAMPEFYQYLYFLLRGENVDESMRITEGAQATLAQDHAVNYKKYEPRRGFDVKAQKDFNTQEIIDTFLNPNKVGEYNILVGDTSSKIYQENKNNPLAKKLKDTTIEYRMEYVDQTLLPTFTELLFQDMKNWVDEASENGQESGEPQEGESGESGSGESKKWEKFDKNFDEVDKKMEEQSPDFIPDEAIEEYAEWKEGDDKKDAEGDGEDGDSKDGEPKDSSPKSESKQGDDKNPSAPIKTPEQIAKEEQAKQEEIERKAREERKEMIDNFAKENDIDPDTARRVAEAYEDVHKEVDDLFEVWRRIVLRSENEVRTNYSDTAHKDGDRFDVNAFVRSLPGIVRGEYEKVNVFNRLERVDNPSDRPERIEVSLVIDQSGSMGRKGSELNKVIERVITMMNMSLDGFNELLVANKNTTKSKLHLDREIILVADTAKTIIPFSIPSIEEADINLGVTNYKSLETIGSGVVGNSNQDHKAFEVVRSSVDEEKLEKIKAGKILKIVIEITDGEPDDDAISKMKSHIREMSDQGVVVCAVQIGTLDASTFDDVWNSDSDGVKRGYSIGQDFKKLPQVIAQMLEKYIGAVKIYE